MNIPAYLNGQAYNVETKLEEAMECAAIFATKSGLPMCVFINSESNGWWYTNPMSPRLERADTRVHVTMLPQYYFAGHYTAND